MHHSKIEADVGVIIGRFQVPELHEGHKRLIDQVLEAHKKVVVLLGVSPVPGSFNNPLDFESRKQMLMTGYPNLTVLYIRDVNNDELWSKTVDDTLTTVLGPTQTALLYGGRDSFINHYSGRWDTFELPDSHVTSGTMIRDGISKAARDDLEWRAGVIWASRNRFPTVYPTVDVAIFNEDYSKILLGKRDREPAWRLIGGFADPSSTSFEEDARREAYEEATVTLSRLSYIGSMMIDDWRYKQEPDCIKTLLFAGTTADKPFAGDDIDQVEWLELHQVGSMDQHLVMKLHRPLVTKALMYAQTRKAKK